MVDPLTIVGGVATSLQLVSNVHAASVKVMRMYQDIRDVDQMTASLCNELSAFEQVLFLLRNETARLDSTATLPSAAQSEAGRSSRLDPASLEDVLTNAQQTIDRLIAIHGEISKPRKFASGIRKSHRAEVQQEAIGVLRSRMSSYVQILNVWLRILSE